MLGERLGNAVSDAIMNFFSDQAEQSIQWLADILVGIFSTAQNVLDMPIVTNGIAYAQGIAFALLIVKVMWDAFHVWILYSNGDAEADPKGLLLNTFKAIAIIGSLPWGIRYLYQVGSAVALEVSQLSGIGETSFTNFLLTWLSGGGLLLTIAILVSVVLVIIVFIQSFIRAATLGLLAVIGPIIAVQQVGGGQLFNMWLKELLVVCFSQAIQIFMLLAACWTAANIVLSSALNGLMLLGWLWATVKAPGTLRQMLYSSGAGGAVGGAAQTAGTMIIVRKMMTKGA